MARERCITVVPKLHELAVITRLGALGSRAEIAELFSRMHQVVRRTLTIRANRRPRLLFSADARGRTICVARSVQSTMLDVHVQDSDRSMIWYVKCTVKSVVIM